MKLEMMEREQPGFYDLRSQLRDHIYRRSLDGIAQGIGVRDEIRDPAKLQKHNAKIRSILLERLGGLPTNSVPLQPQVTGVVAADGFTIEKVIFQSRPQTYVTANLYIPEGVRGPQGAVLFVLGHSDVGKQNNRYQIVSQTLVRAGLIVLVMDPIGQGERLSYYDSERKQAIVRGATGEHEHVGLQCWPLGDGLARYFIHDIQRACDYLCSRPEVDPSRIGITGSSGGGNQTALAMICEERFAAAAPGTFVTSREEIMLSGLPQDAEQILPGLAAFGFDHEDFLLAFAPKPLMVLAATEDFFPIEGTRRTVARAKRFWEMYGRGEQIELYEDETFHQYSDRLAQAAACFFAKHLSGKQVEPTRYAIEPLRSEQLWCTSSGQVQSEYPGARIVYDENCDRLLELERDRAARPEASRKRSALDWLRRKVVEPRRAEALNPRYLTVTEVEGESLTATRLIWRSQVDLFGHALLFSDPRFEGKPLPVTVAVWEGGTSALSPHMDWIRGVCAQGRLAMVVDVAGVGALLPHPVCKSGMNSRFGTLHKLSTDLFALDDSLAAIRTFDLLRAIEMALQLKNGLSHDLRLYAHGAFSVYARLAAELDERASRLEVEQGFGSIGEFVRSRYYESEGMIGLIMPGLLRHLDVR